MKKCKVCGMGEIPCVKEVCWDCVGDIVERYLEEEELKK